LKFFSIGGILVGGVLGALAGSILTPIAALIESHDDVPPIQLVLALAMAAAIGAFLGTVPGFILGLIAALPIWFVSGLVGGVTDTLKADKVSPNQGIKLSRKNALIASIIICLIVGLPVGLLSLLSGGLLKAVSLGLLAGMIGGLIGGLSRGGSAFIKHYALRLILWLSGCTPFKFIKFLDHSAKLILLKKVGGGYIFIHRMLLDYFAEMTPAKTGKI